MLVIGRDQRALGVTLIVAEYLKRSGLIAIYV